MSTLVSGVRSTVDQFTMHDLVASNSIFGWQLNQILSLIIFLGKKCLIKAKLQNLESTASPFTSGSGSCVVGLDSHAPDKEIQLVCFGPCTY